MISITYLHLSTYLYHIRNVLYKGVNGHFIFTETKQNYLNYDEENNLTAFLPAVGKY